MQAFMRSMLMALGILVAAGSHALAATIQTFQTFPGASEPLALSGDGRTLLLNYYHPAGLGVPGSPQIPALWTARTGVVALPTVLPAPPLGGSSPFPTAPVFASGLSFDGSLVSGTATVRRPSDLDEPEGRLFLLQGGSYVDLGTVGTLGGDRTAMSGDGSVIVGTRTALGLGYPFRWTNGTGILPLGDLGLEGLAWVEDLARDGSVIVGEAWSADLHARVPFRWTERTGMMTVPIPVPAAAPGTSNAPIALGTRVSADGAVIVSTVGGYGVAPTAYRWTERDGAQVLGGFTALGLSGDGSVVVGRSDGGAVLWTAQDGLLDLESLLARTGERLPISGMRVDSLNFVSDDGRTFVGMLTNGNTSTPFLFKARAPLHRPRSAWAAQPIPRGRSDRDD